MAVSDPAAMLGTITIFRDRLTVGRLALTQQVEVRILVPELFSGSSNGRTMVFETIGLGSNPSPEAL